MLSDDSIRKRQRRNTIGIQITVISWMFEFLAGSILIVRHWASQQHLSEEVYRLLLHLDTSVCLVPIPMSYLLNNEDVKLFIRTKGWTTLLRRCGTEESENDNSAN